jgi:MOSC domain-containing protein YiiM
MKLISVNLGQERTLQRKDRTEQTGIFKIPTMEAVWLSKLGLKNDVIVSKRHHGGPDQAVYVYGTTDYEWWEKEIGKKLVPGSFGDNLTISNLESAQFNIGDYLYIADVTLQVTAPRIPCNTFAMRMDDPLWVKKFRHAERPGLYCRVLKEGFVQAGAQVTTGKYAGETLSVLQMYRDYYDRNKSEATLRLHLNAPIAIRARVDLERELQQMLG